MKIKKEEGSFVPGSSIDVFSTIASYEQSSDSKFRPAILRLARPPCPIAAWHIPWSIVWSPNRIPLFVLLADSLALWLTLVSNWANAAGVTAPSRAIEAIMAVSFADTIVQNGGNLSFIRHSLNFYQ
jgi:hypothetical protein